MNLQAKVNSEFKKLLDEKHITKLTNFQKIFFVSPILVNGKERSIYKTSTWLKNPH